MVDAASVDVAPGCAALATWNGRADLDEKGAVVWRELLGQFAFRDVEDAGALYATAFDPKNPIHTPSTLVPKPMMGDDPIVVALAKAITTMAKAKLAPDATLREAPQYSAKGTKKIAIPGGQDLEGAANVVTYYGKGNLDTTLLPEPKQSTVVDPSTALTVDGYLCTQGSSFVMVA